MENNIDRTLDYYCHKRKEILDFVNVSKALSPDQIIESGEELAILE